MSLNSDLLAILACPLCHGPVHPVDDETGIECPSCQCVFPVRDKIPVMIQEEAIRKDDWDRGQRTT